METKRCTKCEKDKWLKEFYKSKSTKDGYRFRCKTCEKTANAERESLYSETRKNYRQQDVYKQIKRDYYKENKEKILEENAAWRQTFKGRLQSYKRAAKKRNIDWLLTDDEFLSFWGKQCYYCDDEISTVGIDRIDNNKCYTLENCRPCCTTCNTMKMALNEEIFINKMKQIINNLNNKEND